MASRFVIIFAIILGGGNEVLGLPNQLHMELPPSNDFSFGGGQDLAIKSTGKNISSLFPQVPVNNQNGHVVDTTKAPSFNDQNGPKDDGWSDWKISFLIFLTGVAIISSLRWLIRFIIEFCYFRRQQRRASTHRPRARRPRRTPVVAHLITAEVASTSRVYNFRLDRATPPQNLVPVHSRSGAAGNPDAGSAIPSTKIHSHDNGAENEGFHYEMVGMDGERNSETPPPPYSPTMPRY